MKNQFYASPCTCSPLRSMHTFILLCILLKDLRIISAPCSFRTSALIWILNLNASISGGLVKTSPFRYPHRKKSQGVKSGDLGGDSLSWFNAIILSSKTSCSLSWTGKYVCRPAPSWAHYTWLKSIRYSRESAGLTIWFSISRCPSPVTLFS